MDYALLRKKYRACKRRTAPPPKTCETCGTVLNQKEVDSWPVFSCAVDVTKSAGITSAEAFQLMRECGYGPVLNSLIIDAAYKN